MNYSAKEVKRKYIDRLPAGYGSGSPDSVSERIRNGAVELVGASMFNFDAWKKQAIDAAKLKEGDSVVVFCCGTGYDFPFLHSKIGNTGKILGVDFSPLMLKAARECVQQNGWSNVELVEADVTRFVNNDNSQFDAAVCTLGISIIPEWEQAIRNLMSFVKSGGEVIIGDLQLATGWRSFVNPLILTWVREYGGSYAGHENALKMFALMESELTDVRSRQFFFGAYRYCVGIR